MWLRTKITTNNKIKIRKETIPRTLARHSRLFTNTEYVQTGNFFGTSYRHYSAFGKSSVFERMSSVLVYGGAGQLGDAVVVAFKNAGYETVSVDFRESSTASFSITLTGALQKDVDTVVETLTSKNLKFDAIVCTAGGWTGGDIKSSEIFSAVDKMWKFNVESAIASSHIASHFLKENGLLALTGAAAGTGPTPGMIAYGITKAATHHLVSSLAANGSGLPNGATVAAILPICLDTATNRQGMPGANFDDWTPLDVVANLLLNWSQKDKPANGSLVKLVTKNKETTFEFVQ